MITVRTIGYHEKAPNTNSSGSRKSSVVRPPPRTHVTGVLLGTTETSESPRFVSAGSRS